MSLPILPASPLPSEGTCTALLACLPKREGQGYALPFLGVYSLALLSVKRTLGADGHGSLALFIMIKYIFFFFVAFTAVSLTGAVLSPEQQAQTFVFALHDSPDVGRALQGLIKDSPTYLSHPERIGETSAAIERVLKEFGPVQYSRFLKKDDPAPVLMRLYIVSDTAGGPVFWGFTFYRKDPKIEEWKIVSLRLSGSAEDILR